ncbi:hypothetical protein MMC13_005848 [Lambiella insularis]|nr:hypothetical protein [Lambiella insularis]
MSRSAIDATRFTATSPHAFSKPSSLRSTASNTFSPSSYPRSHALPRNAKKPAPPYSPPGGSLPPTETAAQKVARLRAAHIAQKQAQISRWDKVVVRGRTLADAAHRFTVYSLIGFSVIAGGVAMFSLGDMIIYNRRKRKSFFAEQVMIYQQRLAEAREAAANGTADEDQMLLINRERAAEEAEAARQKRKGVWSFIKGAFGVEGLRQEETESGLAVLGEQGLRKMGEESTMMEPTGQLPTPKDDIPKEATVMEALEEKQHDRENDFRERRVVGGPLDQLADQLTTESKRLGASWLTSR